MRTFVVAAFALCTAIGNAAGQSPTPNDWHLGNNSLSFSRGTTPGIIGQDVVHVTGDAGVHGWTSSFGAMTQLISLAQWHGKRVRVSLRLKSEGDMRNYIYFIAPAGQSLVQKQDGSGWQVHDFVTDVPANGGSLLIDLGLVDKGGVWVDSVALEEVSTDVALDTTRRLLGVSGGPVSAQDYYARSRTNYALANLNGTKK